ncbi:hypothetical protein PSN_4959 [Pseudomonas sp. NGC7]
MKPVQYLWERVHPRTGQNRPYIPLNVSVLSPLPFKGYS